MSLRKNIELLIKILEQSKINDLEVSSFWGFRKIKLSKNKLKTSTSMLSSNENESDLANTVFKNQGRSASGDEKEAAIKRPDTAISSNEDSLDLKAISATETVEAPLVGTVYLSAKPGEPQFVKENDFVKKGQVICIIEAMKIFNEIESDKDGLIKRIMVNDEDPIEFGQPIIEIEPQ